MSYRIGRVVFWTKVAMKEFFSDMLRRYQNEEEILGDDALALNDLLQMHPDYELKRGVGVAGFFKRASMAGASCFWLRRIDDSVTDFSMKSCIAGKAPTLIGRFSSACREAVWKDINAFKKANAELFDGLHVDHEAPNTFEAIVKDFIAKYGIVLSEELFEAQADNQFRYIFSDENMAESFRQFHNIVAKLRIIPATLNIALGNRLEAK